MLLRIWVCPCNAGGHSFFFFSFFCYALEDEIFILPFVLHARCIFCWRFCYSDIKATEKLARFLPLKHYFSFLASISRTYILP